MLTQRSDVMLSEVEASKNHIKIDPSYRQDDNFAKTNLGSTSILLPFFIAIECHPERMRRISYSRNSVNTEQFKTTGNR